MDDGILKCILKSFPTPHSVKVMARFQTHFPTPMNRQVAQVMHCQLLSQQGCLKIVFYKLLRKDSILKLVVESIRSLKLRYFFKTQILVLFMQLICCQLTLRVCQTYWHEEIDILSGQLCFKVFVECSQIFQHLFKKTLGIEGKVLGISVFLCEQNYMKRYLMDLLSSLQKIIVSSYPDVNFMSGMP